MTKTITVFTGDGIGPEIVEQVLRVLRVVTPSLQYECFEVGEAEWKRNGKLIPDEALVSFEKNKVLLKAPITTPVGQGFRSLNVTLRTKYDLYANIRPAKNLPGVKTRYDDVDMVIFRENTEDLYVGVEQQIDEDTVHATKIITRKASQRIITDAFAYAKAHGLHKVTCIHKANILKMSDGLFREIFYETAKQYPEIEALDMIVDNACMQMVMNPAQFEVMVMPNLYGDILSDLASGLIGGLGLLASANIGFDMAMFEAVHGSAPDIAGKHIANPTALLLSAGMMLDHLGYQDQANQIRQAINVIFIEGLVRTADLGGNNTTEDFINAILKQL